MGSDMKDEGGERIVHREGAGKKESDEGRGHYELVSPLFMRRLSIWLEKGAKKYNPRNWEKGIPKGRIIRALLRHTYEYLEGMENEDHLAAIACNIMFLIHFDVGMERGLYSPEDVAAMQDLPNYITKLEDTLEEMLQCIHPGCCYSKWDSEDYCKKHYEETLTMAPKLILSRAARLKDASERYYAAKDEMTAIQKEMKMEPLFICAFQGCERTIPRENKWCLSHYPREAR